MHSRTLRGFPGVRCHFASREESKAVEFNQRLGGSGHFGSYDAALASPNIDVALDVTAVDSLSCSLTELRLRVPTLSNAGTDVLRDWASEFCKRVTYLLEHIGPRLPAHKLSGPRCARLAEAVRGVLGRALEAGGTTLRDFRDAHGVAGSFQMQAQVYGREGEPCRVCATPIRRIVQGQRSTFFCPQCQRR